MSNQKSENTPLSSPSSPLGSYDVDEMEKLYPWINDPDYKTKSPGRFQTDPSLTDAKIKHAQEIFANAAKGLLDDPEKSFYSGNSQKGVGALNKLGSYIKKNPKQSGVMGIITALLVTLGLGGGLMLGPLQLNHFANLLTDINFGPSESQTDIRMRKLFAYSAFIKNVNGFEKTRLGTIEAFQANRIDAKLEKSGIKSNFDPNGKFTGFSIDETKLPPDVAKDLDGLNDSNDPNQEKRKKAYAKHFKVSASSVDFVDGKPQINPKGMRESRKMFSQAMKISPDFHGNVSALSKRVLIKRANVSLNPITRLENKALTKFADKYVSFQEKRAERISGKDVNIPDAKAKQAEVDPEAEVGEDKAPQYNDSQKQSADLVNKLKMPQIPGGAAAGAAASGIGVVIGAICLVKDISDGVADMQLTERLTTATNIAAEAISWPSKMFTGDFDIEAMFMYISTFYSKEQGSAFGASTLQKEDSTSFTKTGNTVDLRTLDKPENQEFNPDLNSNWSKIDETFKSLGPAGEAIDVVCKVMDTPGQWLAKIGDTLTLGLSTKISDATVGKLMSNLMGVLAGKVDTKKIIGSVLGELANIGGRLMAGSTAASTGAQVASEQTESNAKAYYQDYKYLNDDRSTFAKLFNVLDIDSVASKTLISTYNQSTVESFANLPASTFLSFSNFLGVAKAAGTTTTTKEDYYGIPVVITDPAFSDPPEGTTYVTTDGQPVEFDNPYKLITEAQQRLKDNPGVKEYLEKCNKIKIDDDMYATTQSAGEGAAYNYMIEDGGCEDPTSAGNYTLNDLPKYQSVAKRPSLAKSIAGIFNPTAIAQEPVQPQTITLTPEQAALAQTIMALTYTKEGIGYAALEENDDKAMQMMYDGVAPASNGQQDSTNAGPEGWTWPLKDKSDADVSNGWGDSASKGIHKAIDIAAPDGTPVLAAHDGEVVESYYSTGCGYFYLIKATGTPYWMTYQHLQTLPENKKKGDKVTAGEEIGKVGEYCGSGYHLHFGVEKSEEMSFYASSIEKSIDPLEVLP